MSNIEKQAELATNIKLSFRQRLDYSISEFGYNSIYYWISAFMRCSCQTRWELPPEPSRF